MSKAKINNAGDAAFLSIIKSMDIRLERLQKSHSIGRHRVFMLTNKEKLVDFSGTSSVGWTDKNIQLKSDGVTASSASDKSIAAIIQIAVRDTASASTASSIQVRKNGSSDDPSSLFGLAPHINSTYAYIDGIVGVDSAYVLEYKTTASGVGTLTGAIYLIGYIEQL